MPIVEKKKQGKRYSKEWLTEEEVGSLLKLRPINWRDLIILYLLYGCALRVSELCNLQVEDIMGEKSRLIIRKSKNEPNPTVVPIPKKVMKILQMYMAACEYKSGNLLTGTNKSMNRKTIYVIVKNLAKKAGIKKRITPHTFRRSRATHLLDAGLPIEKVSQLLRHKQITTTQEYLKLSPEKLQEAMKDIDPLEKK